MTICDNYNIGEIVSQTEILLQIDSKDYGEKDFNVIMDNIYTRILRQTMHYT